jgi:hypothetical protein
MLMSYRSKGKGPNRKTYPVKPVVHRKLVLDYAGYESMDNDEWRENVKTVKDELKSMGVKFIYRTPEFGQMKFEITDLGEFSSIASLKTYIENLKDPYGNDWQVKDSYIVEVDN